MIKQLTSALCGLMLLTGCAVVGPDYRLTPTELGGEFANASQGGLSSDSIDTTWWRGFKDKELDRLVDLALRANHDRRIASARLREARALWSETSLDRYPTVTAGASYSNEQLSTAAIPGTRLIAATVSFTAPVSMPSGSSISSAVCAARWRPAPPSSKLKRRAYAMS